MARDEQGLQAALRRIPALREEFWKNVKVTGQNDELNQTLEYAGRVADFWNLPSCCARTPCIAANLAAGISAPNFRRRRAKPGAMTSISPMSPPGNSRAPARRRF